MNSGEPQVRRLFRETSGTNCLDISPNSQATTGGSDGCIRIYDLSSEKMIRDCSWHSSRIFSVKWKDYSVLLSGGWDNVVRLWDTRTRGTSLANISGPHICGDAIDSFDNFILTGSWKKQAGLELWDCRYQLLVLKHDYFFRCFLGFQINRQLHLIWIVPKRESIYTVLLY